MPTSSFGHRYIFVTYDVFTKFVKIYPLRNISSKLCADKLVRDYIPTYGPVTAVLSDNVSEGKGIILYKEFTPANKWIRKPDRLTSSEWRLALKMTVNICPLRAIPGRSRDRKHCRRCVSEIETLGHVLGACPFSETLRNSRHHRISSMIAEALRKKDLTVHGEIHGISQEGSCRRIDVLAIPPGSTSAYIIDPTVRIEAQEQQPADSTQKNAEFMSPQFPSIWRNITSPPLK
ncbi:hypothetical protein ANN_13440 [Periplaneta americana]|uniref:Integrase catalytic domain-containing protein n=1 Tax=Periplaneta americana TaxID=6978 RepID=A0ABQ8TJF9_PERAM|nr:hypothetical protein ANN_13440 [Periplaneta americana]